MLVIASSVDVEGAVSVYWVTVGRRGIDAHSDSQDTWDGCDLLPDLLGIRGARFPRLKGRVVDVQPDAELHDVCGIVAEGHLHKLEKAVDGGARRGHEKKREGDLRRDENTPAML